MIEVFRVDRSFVLWPELLGLITSSFAYMDGVIDPPSSAHRLNLENLQEKSVSDIAFIAMENDRLVGCIFCKPEASGTLYVGKLAIAVAAQGKGIGFQLLSKAEELARNRQLSAMRLETRIELVDNHRKFASWGFVKTAENSHPGYTRVTSIEMTKYLS